MYPENIQELIDATKELLFQVYPPTVKEFNAELLDKAWIRTSEAVKVLEAQDERLQNETTSQPNP